MGNVFSGLHGTTGSVFKVGSHRLSSAGGGTSFIIERRYGGGTILDIEDEYYSIKGKRFFSAAAVPVAGTFVLGDIVWNTNTSNGIAGWVCTTAGTPGLWSEIGSGAGGGGGFTFGANTETLTANKTLISSDAYYQLLNPSGANRMVTLAPDWTGIITNDSAGSHNLILNDGVTTLATLSVAENLKSVLVWNDGTDYIFMVMATFGNELVLLPPTRTFINLYELVVTNRTYPLFTAPGNLTLDILKGVKLEAGTCTITIAVDGVAVTSLQNLAVTTTSVDHAPSGTVDVVEGERVTLIVSSASVDSEGLEATVGVSLSQQA